MRWHKTNSPFNSNGGSLIRNRSRRPGALAMNSWWLPHYSSSPDICMGASYQNDADCRWRSVGTAPTAGHLTLTSPRYRFRRYVQFVSWWQPTAKNRLQGHAEHAPISVHLHLSTVFAWVVFIFCLVEHHFHFWDNNIVIILSTQLLQWSWFLYALETRMFYFSIGFHTNRKWFQPKLVGTLQWGIQDQNWGTKPLLSIR